MNTMQPSSSTKPARQMTPQQTRRMATILLSVGVLTGLIFVVVSWLTGNWHFLVAAAPPVVVLTSMGLSFCFAAARASRRTSF